jgi:hypothetical protein
MRRSPWYILALFVLGSLFFPWLLIFAACVLVVIIAGLLTGGRK